MTNGRNETLEFTLEGLPRDEGHVPVGSFLYQLRNFYEALNQTDRLISGAADPTSDYRIIDMHHGSPATVTVEARAKERGFDVTADILDGFIGAFDEIEETGEPPRWADRDLLEHFRNLNSPVGETVASARIGHKGRTVELSKELEAKIDLLLAPVESFEGSVKGRLEAINLHANKNTFRIYPTAGPNRVTCHFPEKLRLTAVRAVDRTVIVSGTLKYNANAPFPHEIYANDIEITPPDDELPGFLDLRGMGEGATEGTPTLEFIRRVRDEWE